MYELHVCFSFFIIQSRATKSVRRCPLTITMDYDLLDHSGEMGDPFSDKFETDSLDIHEIIGIVPRVVKTEPIAPSSQLPQSQQSASSGNRCMSSGSDNMEFETDSDAQSRTDQQSDKGERSSPPPSNHICKSEIGLKEYMALEKSLKESANTIEEYPPTDVYIEKRRTYRRYGPGLDCIMADHNYSNQLDDSQDGFAPIDANDLTLSELLERVQDKLCEGSPVYDVRLELLSLVASLANEKVDMSKDFMNSIDDKLKLIKLSMEASSQSNEVIAPDTVEMVPIRPETVEVDVQTDEAVPVTREPHIWENSAELEENMRKCLKKFQMFGEDIPNTNAQLFNDLMSQENNGENHLAVMSNYIGTLESGFREIVKEFKAAANLTEDQSKSQKSPNTSARQLNQRSKERWLTHSSSDEEETNSQKSCKPRKQKTAITISIIDETTESQEVVKSNEVVSAASEKELLDAVESIEGETMNPETTMDDSQRTLSCDYMEKLVYDTDSNDGPPNDVYESFDNYQPIEPLDEQMNEELHESVSDEKPSASSGYAEVSGMSDEEFLGFAEDISFDPASQTMDIKVDSTTISSDEPAAVFNTDIKEEEPLDMGASQSQDSEEEPEGLDNLLNATSDKDFEFDGEFFLDSVCDEPTAERLLEAAQTFEDENVVDRIEQDHEEDHSETLLKHETEVEKQSEEIEPEAAAKTDPDAFVPTDKVVDDDFEHAAEMETSAIDYLHEEETGNHDFELDTHIEPAAIVSIEEEQDEVDLEPDSLQATVEDHPEPDTEMETSLIASEQDEETKELVTMEQVDTSMSTPLQDDQNTEHVKMEDLERSLIFAAQNDSVPDHEENEEIVETEQVATDQVQNEEVPIPNEKLESIVPVQQDATDPPELQIEDSSSHESAFMMPVEVQMNDEDDDASLHLPGDENGVIDDEDDEEKNAEREIARLLDFSNLNVRKRAHDGTYYVPLKKPEPSKQPKPVAASLIDDIAQAANDCSTPTTEQPSDTMSDVEDDVLTEEQYLHQCNMTTKEKLMMMLSSDSEGEQMSGSEDTMSGVESEAIDDEEGGDNSRDSAIEVFLKKKVNEEMNSLLKVDAPKTNGVAKEEENGFPEANSEEKPKAVTDETAPEDVPQKDNSSDSTESDDEIKAPTKFLTKQEKHIMGKSIFSGLDDFLAQETPEPVIDLNEIDAISERSSLSSDCELLDTSMFKSSSKSKEIDEKKLSRLMKSSRRAAVAKAAQPADDCISLSSDTDLELDEDVVEVPDDVAEVEVEKDGSQGDKNRAPRRMLRADQLADATKSAQTEEKERVKRLEKKAERLAQLLADTAETVDSEEGAPKPLLEESDVVLDYDSKAKCRITVHPDIVKHLKPHQVDGVKFMYDSCYGSVDDKHAGSGCILAHCMGLGKTLQLIALLHTLIRHTQLKTNKILVICPKSTVMNWAEEIERWLGPVRGGPSVKVFQFPDSS